MIQDLVIYAVYIGYAVAVLLLFGTVLTWVERKQAAIMSDRIGANRAYVRIPFTQVKLVWWGLFVYTVPVLHGAAFAVVAGPVFITLLLLFVSGIPPLERSADQRHANDPAYREYKRRTSILVPLPPRS